MNLFLYEVSKKAWIFKTRGKGTFGCSFIFDIKNLPQKPEPQKIVIERRVGKYLQRFTMSWKQFLSETAIGDVICIDWSRFKKSIM